jgi:hypothetical protein
MNRLDLLLAAGVFVLSFCSAPISEGQGIRGTVLLGPNCPVVQEGIPCPDTPFQTDLVLTSADNSRVITQITSDANGEFEVNLPTGTYGIRSPNQGGLPFCSTNEVIVVQDEAMTEVAVFCDTGIR